MLRLPHTDVKQQYITTTGMAELQQRLQDLKCEQAKIIHEMRELTSQSSAGNGLEDSVLAMHQDRILELDSQVSRLQYVIGTAKIIDRPASNTKIQIGSQVTLDIGGTQRTYTIVGTIEADPVQGKVSDESPLGQSLLGRKVNDRFELAHPAGSGVVTTVIAIE